MAADGDLDQRLVTVLDVEATIAKIFAVFDKDGARCPPPLHVTEQPLLQATGLWTRPS